MIRARLPWVLLAVLVLAQIGYPLTGGRARAALTVATVLLGCGLSVSHALLARGPRAAVALIGTATLGGFAVEAAGVATGFPFGHYDYSGELGPRLLGVPLVIPLAWTWMAWPAWLAAARLLARPRRWPIARIALAGFGLAAWDIFLDPQMVGEGYWRWRDPEPALPGVPGVPIGNYLGWLGFALLLMAALAAAGGPALAAPLPSDTPMIALWVWTYVSSVLAHAVFLGLPGSACWGAALMAATVLPLARRQPLLPAWRPFSQVGGALSRIRRPLSRLRRRP